jgi:integrase
MHPKLVQERAGHSDIKLTTDVYGELASRTAPAQEQEACFDDLASKALPAPV